jgi:hypothetical protein
MADHQGIFGAINLLHYRSVAFISCAAAPLF